MRRSTRTVKALGAGILLTLIAATVTDTGRAQEVKQEAKDIGKAVIVPLNQTIRLQMTTKNPISRVTTSKENVVGLRIVQGDPTTIMLIGLTPDIIKLTLVDNKGNEEHYEIIVQLDVEYLRTQLKRVIPTANINPVPYSNNGVVLTGTVQKAEDVDTVMKVAAAAGGLQIINAMRLAGVQQVQLDVVIAQVSRNDFRGLAFNFQTESSTSFLASTVGNAITQPVLVGFGSAQLSNGNVNGGTPGTPNGQATNIMFGILNSQHGFLGFLQALRVEGVSKDLAQPTLVTMSGTAGSFLVGGEQAVPIPAGLGQVGVQFEEFGTRVNYLPIVLGNGKIHLELEPEISSLSAANGTNIQGTVVPGRVTNRTHVTVELEAGQTFVIAGLIQNDVTGATNKVPILGDLPFLGVLFSSKTYTETEQEMVVLVTPHLVDAQDCAQLTKCLPGQESRRPDDFELFLENILEAPRGQREVFQDHHYVAPYKNGPTSDLFPCGGGLCGAGAGCGAKNCGTAASVPAAPVAPAAKPVAPPPPMAIPETVPVAPQGRPALLDPPTPPAVLPTGRE